MINKKEVKDYYNHSLKILDEGGITFEYKDWLDAELLKLEEVISKNSTVLEIGAGNGRIIDKLNNNQRKITGIDIANLSNLLKKYSESPLIKIFEMDAEKLSFKNCFFDFVIIAYNTLGLMENPLRVLEECKRVVKNKGIILISTYKLDEGYCLAERMKCFKKIGHEVKTNGLDLEISDGVASHYFTKEELEQLFKKANLNFEKISLTKLGCLWKLSKIKKGPKAPCD